MRQVELRQKQIPHTIRAMRGWVRDDMVGGGASGCGLVWAICFYDVIPNRPYFGRVRNLLLRFSFWVCSYL